jgi:integrase
MATKLTAGFVRQVTEIEPPTRATAYFDIVVPRFYLRVKPPARPGQPWPATYFVKYVAPGGRRRAIKVGNPVTMELDEARAAARKALGRVDNGGDPAADRTLLHQAWTVAEAVAAYRTRDEFKRKSARSQHTASSVLAKHIVHRLGGEKLAAIDVPAVRRLQRSIESDKRINSRKRKMGGPGAAKKAVRVLSSLLTWAVGEGRLERNPIIGNLRLSGDNQRETVIGSKEEYARLYAAMDDLVATGEPPLRPMVRAFVIVAALTGARRGELQSLRWGDIDLTEGRIVLRGTKGSKLAKKGAKLEHISLPWRATDALIEIEPEDGSPNDLVFVPIRGERMSVNRDWNRIRDAAKLPADLTLHGLRHSVGTAAVTAGLSLPEVQRLLRHRNVSVTSRYIHLAERQARLQDRATAQFDPEPVELSRRRPRART